MLQDLENPTTTSLHTDTPSYSGYYIKKILKLSKVSLLFVYRQNKTASKNS